MIRSVSLLLNSDHLIDRQENSIHLSQAGAFRSVLSDGVQEKASKPQTLSRQKDVTGIVFFDVSLLSGSNPDTTQIIKRWIPLCLQLPNQGPSPASFLTVRQPLT